MKLTRIVLLVGLTLFGGTTAAAMLADRSPAASARLGGFLDATLEARGIPVQDLVVGGTDQEVPSVTLESNGSWTNGCSRSDTRFGRREASSPPCTD